MFVGFQFQCNEKEAEILSLSTNIEVLKLENSEIQSERRNLTSKAKTQVDFKYLRKYEKSYSIALHGGCINVF